MPLKFVAVLGLFFSIALAGCAPNRGTEPAAIPPDQTLPVEQTLPPPAAPTLAVDTATPTLTATPKPSPTQTVSPTATSSPTPTPSSTPTPFILTGAGDISICGNPGDAQTAALLAVIPGEIFTAGDNSNEDGSAAQLKRCFGKTWGQFKDRIHPAPGNHDYYTQAGAPYYAYFGAAAGHPGQGWYSYAAGAWHVVVLNSNCNDVACGKESSQLEWLRADLATYPAKCTLAIWHHPRWSSGLPGSDGRMSAAYRVLYEAGAEMVISGHDHDYERFMPLDPQGNPDVPNGIRQFVVGTGGAYPRQFSDTILPGSEEHKTDLFGVLKLSLYPDHYDWQFISTAGETYTDTGSAACH